MCTVYLELILILPSITSLLIGALTGDVDYVYGDVMEEYYQDGIPDPGTWIACEVSTIINPAHFYLLLPFGKEPLASLEPGKKEGEEPWGFFFNQRVFID